MHLMEFYRGKRVLITGHTGFKGTWLCKMLLASQAQVFGYSLEPPTSPALFTLTQVEQDMNSIHGDVCDLMGLRNAFQSAQPEVVFHLAAQPLVRAGYEDPAGTYNVNVMGTVNVLECVRQTPSVRSFLNVTTDKVYRNRGWLWAYRENEELNGFDPYANSKSCAELATACYRNAFLNDQHVAVSTARAGNVIGGGDFAKNRIIPDCVRAVAAGRDVQVRNPHSIRPYQHVLDALYAYLWIAAKQYEDPSCANTYNIGPDDHDFVDTGALASLFVKSWGDEMRWVEQSESGPHEDTFLHIDCTKINRNLGWYPYWNVETAVEKTVEWYRAWVTQDNVNQCMEKQILEMLARDGQGMSR